MAQKGPRPGPQGRPVPRPLETEILEKFKRFDTVYAEQKKKKFPHLVTGPKEPNAPGSGSVIWVGLNPDPCKAKWLEKQGITRQRPRSVPPGMGRSSASTGSISSTHRKEGSPGVVKTSFAVSGAVRPFSAPLPSRKPRDLSRISSTQHFLEQSKGLYGEVWIGGPRPGFGAAVEPGHGLELLYSGVSAEEEGRGGYLKARKSLFPQEKYGHTQTSSQEVGWQAYAGPNKFVAKIPRKYKPLGSTLSIC